MHRCSCSTRAVAALETFIKDFAGLSLHRPQPRIFSSQRNAFGTRSPVRSSLPSSAYTEQLNDALAYETHIAAPEGTQTGLRSQRSRKELDEGWDSDADFDAGVGVLGGVNGDGDGLRPIKDVAPRAEGLVGEGMLKKMKRLEKKRTRVAEGTWAPLKREREERRKVKDVGTRSVERSEGSDYSAVERRRSRVQDKRSMETKSSQYSTVEARVEGKQRFARKERIKVVDMAPRRENARGIATGRDADYRAAEPKDRIGAAKSSTAAPKTRRERMRVGPAAREDDSKPSKVLQRSIRAKPNIEPKTRSRLSKSNEQTTRPEKTSNPILRTKAKDRETWQVQKASLARKFGDKGWQPNKRLSPDTLEGIRALHVSDPKNYKTETLAKHFQITPEAIRRILKSKWRPNEDEAEDRRQRWERRGVKKWTEMAELGVRPPAKWRALGVTSKEQREKRGKGKERDDVTWDGRDDGVASESFAGRIL